MGAVGQVQRVSDEPTTPLSVLLYRFDQARLLFVREAGEGEMSSEAESFAPGQERGLIGLVGIGAAPMALPDVSQDARWVPLAPDARACLMVPVRANHKSLGVLVTLSPKVGGLDEGHLALAQYYAREIARRWAEEREQVASSERPPQPALDLGALSDREREVVSALCRGSRLSEIARTLGISTHTARNHLKHVFRKLGVHSQVELLSQIGGPSGPLR